MVSGEMADVARKSAREGHVRRSRARVCLSRDAVPSTRPEARSARVSHARHEEGMRHVRSAAVVHERVCNGACAWAWPPAPPPRRHGHARGCARSASLTCASKIWTVLLPTCVAATGIEVNSYQVGSRRDKEICCRVCATLHEHTACIYATVNGTWRRLT